MAKARKWTGYKSFLGQNSILKVRFLELNLFVAFIWFLKSDTIFQVSLH